MGFQSFIALLNSHRVSSSFISFGISSQILGPRNLIFSVSVKTVRTRGMRNWDLCLKLLGISFLNQNNPFTISGHKPFDTLNILVASCRYFGSESLTEPSISSSSLKSNVLWL